MKKISVFGLGKVGLALAACFRGSGYKVIGVDTDERVVRGVNRGDISVSEPGVLSRLKSSHGGTISATLYADDAVKKTDVSFIIVPTPSNSRGGFSLRYVMRVCKGIARALKRKKGLHIIAVVSTVMPGSSEHILIPYLEKKASRRIGKDFGYCYNPAFIALGEVVKGFIEPDYILIGESDKKAGDIIQSIHSKMAGKRYPIARMTPVEAEITKLASNTHETMRVSFANMLFSLCTEIPGADVDRITSALSHRMGKRFFKGAAPYGGPCWPRDNVALAAFMDEMGVPSSMPRTVHNFNLAHGKYILNKILRVSKRSEKVGLLGLSYKPGTGVIEESFGVKLANWLHSKGRRILAWDPLAGKEAHAVLGDRIGYAKSAHSCVQRSRVIVIVNPLKELCRLDWSGVKNKVVVDCWRYLTPKHIRGMQHYYPLGRGIAADGKEFLKKISLKRLKRLTK